jgi:DNA-directed RNA polymerase specialized sigma24 family protein
MRPALSTKSADLEAACGQQKICMALSARGLASRILFGMEFSGMERFIERSRPVIAAVDNTTPDVARAIHALTDADLARLGALARLWTRGLPDSIGWADVMHEAIARALDGSRKWPPDVPILAFLSGIMRSICEDHWRRTRRDKELLVRDDDVCDLCAPGDEVKSPGPERIVAAAQSVAAIMQLFACDPPALKIIAGLAEGLTSQEIRERYGMSEREYDTTRKRMRRALLRRGPAWSAS